jgi:hypothetical protein
MSLPQNSGHPRSHPLKASFWIKRFVIVFTCGFAVLVACGFLRNRAWPTVLEQSALWAAIGSTIFIATRLYHSSKGRRCEMCRDIPDGSPGGDVSP